MYEKLKNMLRKTKMLYIVEDKLDEDYHLIPFKVICDHISLSDIEKGWETYLKVNPNIILIHVMIEYKRVIDFIQQVRLANPRAAIIVLTANELLSKFSVIEEDIQKLLTYPISGELFITSLENSIEYENFYYYVNNTLLFDPFQSSFFTKDKQISLTNKEAKLLTLLIKNKERIVTYSEIENYVWEDEAMNLNTLTSIVGNIRKKANLNDIIVNYSRQGYQIGKL